ncbi:MAG: hypothetical protein KME64_32310 [Scytonematopsis contorta HA4267-MV1]|jgi:hypothetical protein|nr:hypothetical protein [Scytonematopsis contorta HA4267-MV1]
MPESVQYVTNQLGERVGVLLDLETYHQLVNPSLEDDEVLIGLSLGELQALAESALSPNTQVKLNDLLARNANNLLSEEEIATLDNLLIQIDQLNILKTRARYTLSVKGMLKVA